MRQAFRPSLSGKNSLLVVLAFLFVILVLVLVLQPEDTLWSSVLSLSGNSPPAFATTDYCTEVFALKDESSSWPPPREIPASLLQAFTQNGSIPVQNWWFAERQNGGEGYRWPRTTIDRRVAEIQRNLSAVRENVCYNTDVCSRTLAKYSGSVKGQRGIVFGSQSPWAEALLLAFGASHILTYEYMKIKSDHPQLSSTTPSAMANEFQRRRGGSNAVQKYDFGFSFSSFEHDGLGRYGDPLNPVGDILSITKASCLIKPGGLFFLGLPVGRDLIVWNAHRVYGKLRIPLLLEHFELVEIIGKYSFDEDNFKADTQPILVLRSRVRPSMI